MVRTLHTRREIQQTLAALLIEMFEIEPEDIRPDANLYEDLDIDSIDAVDLIVRLKDLTGKKVDPEQFKEIRTVNDVVDAVEALLRTSEQEK